MCTAGVYLIYAAVTLRALVRYADEPQRGLVMVLLATYGLLLLAEPWISQHRPLRFAQAIPGPLSANQKGWPFALAITLFYLTSQAARLLLERDPAQVPEQLDRLQEMTGSTLSQLRSLIAQLRPPQDP